MKSASSTLAKFLSNKKGFTLIELMIVIAVIAILVTIVIVAINPVKILNDTNDTKRRTEANQVKTALQVYYNDNANYPAALSSLVPTYMKQIPSSVSDYGTYSQPSGNSSYLLSIDVNTVVVDDVNSANKCSGTAGTVGQPGDYYVCPD